MHTDVNMVPAQHVQSACTQLPFHLRFQSVSLPLPAGANRRQPQALCTLKSTSAAAHKATGQRAGKQGRDRKLERGTCEHACPDR